MTLPILTPKQKLLLDFINEFSARHGYAPSQHEIARHFGFKSLGTVQNYLVRLERQGALRKTWNARRGAQVVHAPQPLSSASGMRPTALEQDGMSPSFPLPLLGHVAAGRPIEAVQTDETIEVPPSMLRNGPAKAFALRVVGDSMIEDGILDGDIVVIRKQPTAENGQTVVALVNNEATIKRYYKKATQVELRPANPKYKPILVSPDAHDFRIEGLLMGVIRVCR